MAGSGTVTHMTVKLSQSSFVTLLEKSGLIASDTLAARVSEFQATETDGPPEGELLAQFLIRKGDLTTWQAKKLLLGKHKGFTLGKYKLLSLLGRGGMSSVYLAEHVVMRRRCAIKVLPSKQVNDPAALNRFHQEAQAVAALDDPNIVRAYDVDQVKDGTNEIHFLVMEYVEGRSLQELVDQDGPLPIPEAIDFICQAASGLDHAHQAGMVHRDVKPSNLLLDLTGIVKVLDMGLARFFEQTDQQSLTLQHDQRVLGTADYLSPEQAVDSHGVDTRSDIYSLGGTLYFLLSGHPPFPEGTLAQRLLAHQTKTPTPINEIRPDVPASLVRILERMMAKSRDDRQSSAGQVREELQDWLAQHGDSFADAGRPPRSAAVRRSGKPADPTAHGWNGAPVESFTPPPATRTPKPVRRTVDAAADDVAGDPHLGEFLTSLSSKIDPPGVESDPITSAKTVVSKTRPARLDVDPPRATGDSGSIVTADSHVHSGSGVRTGSHVRGGSAARSGSRVGRSRTKSPAALIGGVAALCALLIGGLLFWPSGDRSGAGGPPEVPAPPDPASPDESSHILPHHPVEPGSEIVVGPGGHFTTIGDAIGYVEHTVQSLSAAQIQTIRVAGGATYPESISIDNSKFGAIRQLRILCEDPLPAVLAPPGKDPVVSLINVERFYLKGFDLAGGERPVVLHVADYLIDTTFENLTFHDVTGTAIEGIGIAGLSGIPVAFRNVLIHQSSATAIGFALDADGRGTNEVLISQCRFGGPLSTGIQITGETSNLTIAECRFDDVGTPILFADKQQPLQSVSMTNNTFRGFNRGVVFAGPPQIEIGSKGVGFDKNLFAGVRGPEVAVEGGLGTVDLFARMGATFNWSEGTADLGSEGVDVFAQDGRRGITVIPFTGTEAVDPVGFLQPHDGQLQSVAAGAPAPSFIGAVPPVP